MLTANVSIIEIIAAVILNCIIGYAWYSPMLFGNTWAKLAGVKMPGKNATKEEKNKGMQSMLGMLVASTITVYVLAHIMSFAQVANPIDAILTAFWMWLGFQAVLQLNTVLFEQKPCKLFLINTAYQLVSLVTMALVIYYM